MDGPGRRRNPGNPGGRHRRHDIPSTISGNGDAGADGPNFPSAVALTPASAKALVAGLTVVSETVKETGLDRDGMTPQTFAADALDVQPVPATNLVKLSVTLTDPSKAQHAAALLATKLVAATRRIDRETAAAAQETVDEELAGARAGLGKAEQEVLEFETRADVEGLEPTSCASSESIVRPRASAPSCIEDGWKWNVSITPTWSGRVF